MSIVLGMTVQEAIDLALARCAEIGADVPVTYSLMVQRISQYQQRLFALGAQWNPDYFGTCVVATPDGSFRVDLLAILDPLEIPETVTRVEIADGGSSGIANGTEVSIVTLSDMEAELPPRALLRRKVIAGVGQDLQGVASLRVYYSPSPLPIAPTALTQPIEIPRPHDGLVPIDLALYLIDKLPDKSDAVMKGREMIVAEQTQAMAAFEMHVRSYVMTMRTRFGSAPHAPPVRGR